MKNGWDLEEARARARVRSRIFGEPMEPVRVGRFVVLEKVGEGAMGVVYAAFDPELDRKVALKLLRPDGANGEADQARLIAEAKAMAKLSHPNVVSAYEVGTYEGRVFIAMEFVDGVTLRAWCEAEQRTTRQRLSVLVAAGEGIAAAHAAGLVHGDFKPENVIIDREGRPRVLDFGLARPFDRAGSVAAQAPVTRSSVAGTPAYMAPEQFDGVVDASSDQFAFCVVAHEVLFGSRPFEAATWQALRDEVRAGRRRPTPLRTSVPRRARSALSTGLAPESSDRHRTMAALLVELERARDRRSRQAVLAGVGVGAGIVAAAMLLAPTSTEPCSGPPRNFDSIYGQTRRTEIVEAVHATRVPYAAATVDAIDAAFHRQISRIHAMERSACEATYVKNVQSRALLSTRMLCLEERTLELNALSAGLTEVDEASVGRVANAIAALTPTEVCGDLEHLRQRTPPPADPRVRATVAALESELQRVRTLHELARYDEALVVAEAVYAEADTLDYTPIRAAAATRLGWAEGRLGRLADAERHLHEGARRGLEAGDPLAMAEAWDMLTYVTAARHSDYPAAERYAGYALALAPQLAGRHATVAAFYGRRGWLHHRMGRIEDALVDQERALDIRERHLGPDHPQTGYSYFYRARALLSIGRYEEALADLERSEKIFTAAFSAEDIMVVRSYHDRACVYVRMGEAAAAVPLMKRARSYYLREFGADHVDTAYIDLDLGRAYVAMERPKLARPHVVSAVERFSIERGAEHLDHGEALAVLGDLERAEGHFGQAAATLRRALAIQSAHVEGDTYTKLEGLEALARVEARRRHFDEARQLFERALRIYDRQYGEDHASSAPVREALAELSPVRN
ncbi:MAG: tetratricopeptide repeat protein [Deltaproteobacteria bacterium]|jgi:tetratricopeptide (TPR) repeat protein/tRNA A-37 threonylcarbamoyl transferase component Bud32